MLQRLSTLLVQFLLAEKVIKAEDEDIYAYGMEMLLSHLLVYGLTAFLAITFHWLGATVVYYGAFLLIRHTAGGYHAPTHRQCALLTMMTYCISMAISQHFPRNELAWTALIMIAFSLVGIYGFAPVDHENKPFSPNERKKYRWQSISAANLLGMVSLALIAIGVKEMLIIALILGMFNASMSVMIGSEVRRRNAQKIDNSIG